MAALKYNQEIKVKVPAKTMFKALVTETVDLLPKAIPNVVKSNVILEGVGIDVGTVYQINLAQGHIKHKIESVQCTQKYEDTPDEGCVIMIEREIRVKEGAEINEEEVKDEEESALTIIAEVEDYLNSRKYPEINQEEEVKDGEESALTTIVNEVEDEFRSYPDPYWP